MSKTVDENTVAGLRQLQASLEHISSSGLTAEDALYLQHAANARLEPFGKSFELPVSFESFEGAKRRTATLNTIDDLNALVAETLGD